MFSNFLECVYPCACVDTVSQLPPARALRLSPVCCFVPLGDFHCALCAKWMNYPPPLPLSLALPSLSPAGETARHKANEVHLLTKRGGLPDTLIKCALQTEVRETEGSSLHSRSCVAKSRHPSRNLQTHVLITYVDFMGKGQHLLTSELFKCDKFPKLSLSLISSEMIPNIYEMINNDLFSSTFIKIHLDFIGLNSWLCITCAKAPTAPCIHLLFRLQSSDHHCKKQSLSSLENNEPQIIIVQNRPKWSFISNCLGILEY